MGKYLKIFHLGVGESAGLLRTNWEMSLTYSPKDNLWSISEIVDGESRVSRVSFLADLSVILMSLCCGSSHCRDRRTGCTTILCKVQNFATYEREVLVYFVASILSGGNLPAYFTTTSTFMAIKSLYEPLVYPNVPLSLLVSFAFKIGK